MPSKTRWLHSPTSHLDNSRKPASGYYEKAIFILTGVFAKSIRHSRRSGNPEPPSCAKTFMPAKTRRVQSPTSHLNHPCRPASGWMGERVLDSRCGEKEESDKREFTQRRGVKSS